MALQLPPGLVVLRAPWGPRSPGGFWPLCLHFLREPCSPSGWLCARQGLQLLGEQSTRWCRPALAKEDVGGVQWVRAFPHLHHATSASSGLGTAGPGPAAGPEQRKTSQENLSCPCCCRVFQPAEAAAAPEPAWHPPVGLLPPSSSPRRGAGGLPSTAAGTSPLPLEDRKPGAADLFSRAWGSCVGARGGSGASAAPAAFSHLPALPSTSWQPGAW